jgi:hypothetical protein
MQVFAFDHEQEITPSCCGWGASVTYWMADTREQARQQIGEETPDGDEPHGLCASCLARLLAASAYDIHRVDRR